MDQQEQLQQQAFDELSSMLSYTNSLKEKKYMLNSGANAQEDVANYIAQIQRFNQSIQNKSLPYSFAQEIRSKACTAAREFCNSLHRVNHRDALARELTKALQKEFNDIPMLKYQLEQDYNTLSKNIRAEDPFPSEEKTRERMINHYIKSALIWRVAIPCSLVVIILLIIFVVHANDTVEFSQSAHSGENVYSYIQSIQPVYTLTDENNHTSDIICKCETDDHIIIWVYMSIEEYKADFDPGADFSDSSKVFEEICFNSSKKISGEAINSGEISVQLVGKTTKMVLDYNA